jgi:hypothetical protein
MGAPDYFSTAQKIAVLIFTAVRTAHLLRMVTVIN